jgi:16S rRNA (guanine527-N7)-methyltransferase
MAAFDFTQAIHRCLGAASGRVDAPAASSLARYLTLLARWNRRINLTAFDLDHPTDHAIDRLIVEPVLAAAEVRERDRVVIDIGSGGGSPALPLKIVRPHVRMTMIEARVRKSAFLREAVRELNLDDVAVETFRLDRGGRADLDGTANVVTMRAVRADTDVLDGVEKLLAPNGRLFWFRDGTSADLVAPLSGWSEALVPNRRSSFLRVLTKAD